jgi:outer membrane protein
MVILLLALCADMYWTCPLSAQEHISLLYAVHTTIEKQPNIRIQQKEVEIKKGSMQSSKGEFDAKIGAFIRRGHEESSYPMSRRIEGIMEESQEDTITYGINLNKKFRSGVSIEPQIGITYTDSSASPFEQVEGYELTNIGRIDFVINIPLLKGRGKASVAANEMTAEKEYQSSLFELHHKTSQYILNTVLAYWYYLAYSEIFGQRKEAEKNAQQLADYTKKLIKGGKSPASELEQIMANLADKAAARIAAEQNLFDAKQQLGIAMGIPFDEIKTLPLPSDNFPVQKNKDILSDYELVEKMIDQALENRGDFLAAKKQEEAGKILLEASKNNLLPQLDLKLNTGYAGLSENGNYIDAPASLQENIAGLNYSALLEYQIPIGNNSAKGIVAQRKAAYDQYILSKNDLERTISSNILSALSNLQNSISELIKAEEAVSFYKNAVKNERNKVFIGISTFFDLVSMEDKLINSQLGIISSKLKLSKALANFRFETGTLIPVKQNHASISVEELTTIPYDK